MPRFLSGDELGNIKSIKFSPFSNADSKIDVSILREGGEAGKARAVQNLAIFSSENPSKEAEAPLVAAVHADGSATVSRLRDDSLELLQEWKEPRLRAGQRYVGLAASSSGVYSCTSNGALRLATLGDASTSQTAVLPMRLADWRLASDGKAFAYGGDEVELSVWDVEAAFASISTPAPSSADTKKRKRSQDLLPGETWRAKNVANDALSLRQPVNNTCLTFLGSPRHLIAGTQFGEVRKYDTRAARRPVANWSLKETARVGGIRAVEAGFHDHEVFVADNGTNLFSVDTRTGRVVYGYKGLAGAVTSIAPSPSALASTALDRYIRVHSTYPPAEPGEQQDDKGEVLEKIYAKTVPTVVVWDRVPDDEDALPRHGDDGSESDEEEVWEGMEEARDDDSEDEETDSRSRRKSGKRSTR